MASLAKLDPHTALANRFCDVVGLACDMMSSELQVKSIQRDIDPSLIVKNDCAKIQLSSRTVLGMSDKSIPLLVA